MEPVCGGGSCIPASRGSMAVSHEADNVTGSNAVDATAGSTSSPLSNARRHLNTWLAFTPLARATSATLAPGSNVNSTIRRFSATERHLRSRRTVPTSSESTMTPSSDSCPTQRQRGRLDAYLCAVANAQTLIGSPGAGWQTEQQLLGPDRPQ